MSRAELEELRARKAAREAGQAPEVPAPSARAEYNTAMEAAGLVQPPDSFSKDTMDVANEFALGANRAITQGADMLLGPSLINSGLELFGSDMRVPTFEGGYNALGQIYNEYAPDFLKFGEARMDPGPARDAISALGATVPAALAVAPVAGGRNLAKPAGAMAEYLGFGAKPAASGVAPLRFGGDGPQVLPPGEAPIGPTVLDNLVGESDETRRVGALIDDGSSSIRRFGKTRDPYTQQVVNDPAARKAAKQGLSKGITSTVQGATDTTKGRLSDMLDIVEQSKDDARYSITNRPLDVAGSSLVERYDVVRQANDQARSQLDDVAQTLRGQEVDASDAFRQFNNALDAMGVRVTRDDIGEIVVDASGSDISQLDAPVRALERLFKRIDDMGSADAHELHRLKRYIDENVSYGRGAEGLSGRVEGIFKNLRRNIDSALDANFEEYNRVNTQYSDTRELLDETNRLISSGADETSPNFEKGVGTLLRRTLSNARSREPMLDLVQNLDDAAKRYAPGKGLVPYREGVEASASYKPRAALDDDVLTQVLFADELDRIFGTNARTSLLGDSTKAVERGVDAALGDVTLTGILAEGAKRGADRVRGVNEEAALGALRDLVKR